MDEFKTNRMARAIARSESSSFAREEFSHISTEESARPILYDVGSYDLVVRVWVDGVSCFFAGVNNPRVLTGRAGGYAVTHFEESLAWVRDETSERPFSFLWCIDVMCEVGHRELCGWSLRRRLLGLWRVAVRRSRRTRTPRIVPILGLEVGDGWFQSGVRDRPRVDLFGLGVCPGEGEDTERGLSATVKRLV